MKRDSKMMGEKSKNQPNMMQGSLNRGGAESLGLNGGKFLALPDGGAGGGNVRASGKGVGNK